MPNEQVRDLDEEQHKLANANNVILDKMMGELKLKNDAAVARAMEVAPPVISKLRYGRLPFGPNYVIRTHELTGWPIREIKALLGQESMSLYQKAA